jgi:hypothetical protein
MTPSPVARLRPPYTTLSATSWQASAPSSFPTGVSAGRRTSVRSIKVASRQAWQRTCRYRQPRSSATRSVGDGCAGPPSPCARSKRQSRARRPRSARGAQPLRLRARRPSGGLRSGRFCPSDSLSVNRSGWRGIVRAVHRRSGSETTFQPSTADVSAECLSDGRSCSTCSLSLSHAWAMFSRSILSCALVTTRTWLRQSCALLRNSLHGPVTRNGNR